MVLLSFAWMIVLLFPVLDILPTGGRFADRYVYLASMGFALWLALLISRSKRFYLILAVIFLGYGFKAVHQNQIWQNNFELWFRTSILSKDKPQPHNLFGEELAKRGFMNEAEQEFKEAIRLGTDTLKPYSNLVRLYRMKGAEEKAQEYERQIGALSKKVGG